MCYPWMLGFALRPMDNTALSFWVVQICLGSNNNDGQSRADSSDWFELVNLMDGGQSCKVAVEDVD